MSTQRLVRATYSAPAVGEFFEIYYYSEVRLTTFRVAAHEPRSPNTVRVVTTSGHHFDWREGIGFR